jgi:hypothetical protein
MHFGGTVKILLTLSMLALLAGRAHAVTTTLDLKFTGDGGSQNNLCAYEGSATLADLTPFSMLLSKGDGTFKPFTSIPGGDIYGDFYVTVAQNGQSTVHGFAFIQWKKINPAIAPCPASWTALFIYK